MRIQPRTVGADLAQRVRRMRAFSLLEVMIAVGIFFLALFSILGLVSQMLRNARAIQM